MKKTRLLLPAVLLVLGITGCGLFEPKISGFTVNDERTKSGMPVTAGFELYDADDENIRFLYPEGESVDYDKNDGVAVYAAKNGRTPYLLIKKTDTAGMDPEKFFKACDDQLLKSFADVKSTKIHEVKIDDKTLYMTRYVVEDREGTSLVIERYIEIYDRFYIQYTAVSENENRLDTELYYAIKTLSTADGAYTTGVATSLTDYSSDTGIKVSLPDMLKVSELTIGFMASDSRTIMLYLLCTEDDNKMPVVSRAAFLEKAAQDPGFVASYLGVDSASFGSGELVSIKGRDYYSYPVSMMSGSTEFVGKLLLADADNGCLIACYGVNSLDPDKEDILKVCGSSVETLEFTK